MNVCEPNEDQKWVFEDAGNGYYRMKTVKLKSNNYCLEGNKRTFTQNYGKPTIEGAAIMESCDGTEGQLWAINHVGDGSFTLSTKWRSPFNECLEAGHPNPKSVVVGASHMSKCIPTNGQLFTAYITH